MQSGGCLDGFQASFKHWVKHRMLTKRSGGVQSGAVRSRLMLIGVYSYRKSSIMRTIYLASVI